jgi:hypothetical protein
VRSFPGNVKKTDSRRGSPDVVEKRRAARAFNDVLLGKSAGARDGRTERRRRRLLKELADGFAGRAKRELKPVEVLTRVRELLELGEPLASIRKACPPRRAAPVTDALVDGVRRLHRAYAFPIEAYRFVGIGDEALRAAGVLRGGDRGPAKPGLARSAPRARDRQRGNVA